jgi:hypothetical protein
LFQVDLSDWFSGDHELFPGSPTFKGAPAPTMDSLDLSNQDSRRSLESFFENRASGDQENLALAEGSLRKVLRNERETGSQECKGYLEALLGKFHLDHDRWNEAIDRLEAADRVHPNDPYIRDLLLRAYETANLRLQETQGDWSPGLEKQIRELGKKANSLRQEIRRLQAWSLDTTREGLAFGPDATQCSGLAGAICTRRLGLAALPLDTPASGVQARALFRAAAVTSSTWSTTSRTPRRVLAVGVNKYDARSGFLALSYARRDARRVLAAYDEFSYSGHTLEDGEATRENILDALARESLASRPGDEFVFYFSGHSFTDTHGRNALVTAEQGANRLGTVALDEIERILSYHNGKATVIVDGCLSRMDVDLRAAETAELGDNMPTIVWAGSPGGVAIESRHLRSGLFTEILVRQLDAVGKKTAGNPPPSVDLIQIWDRVVAGTTHLARERYGIDQYPQWYRISKDHSKN